VNILTRFRDELATLQSEGYVADAREDIVSLTRHGLLHVDMLLPRFFLPQHAGIRYT
jgi:oxygen-independent coproporphyrinogen-3 oxidase